MKRPSEGSESTIKTRTLDEAWLILEDTVALYLIRCGYARVEPVVSHLTLGGQTNGITIVMQDGVAQTFKSSGDLLDYLIENDPDWTNGVVARYWPKLAQIAGRIAARLEAMPQGVVDAWLSRGV